MSFYPGAVDYQDGKITIDQALDQPETIEQRIADIAAGTQILDTLFAQHTAPVNGGAVFYSPVTKAHLYTSEDVADRNPGDEYPVLYSTRPEMQVARVQDFGGKFAVTDEAKRRNLTVDFDNDVTTLTNTIVRKINQRAVETIAAAIDGSDDVFELAAAQPWSEMQAQGNPANFTDPFALPSANFAEIFANAAEQDLGVEFDHLLVTPKTYSTLRIIYGTDLKPMLDDYNLTAVVSNHVPAGQAYLVDAGEVGFVNYEESLTVTTWRDEHHRQTWVQGFCMPVMGVTKPSAIAVIRGTEA